MLPIPYNTDAPIYFFPYATIGLIVINTITFIASLNADPKELVNYVLVFGDGLHPVQWLTNNFMHADIMHLVGNMFFLWGFGLVVEGKLGWWKFLLLYLAMGIIYGAILQIVMLGADEFKFALGASGVIFALMMIAALWAPKNEMNCFVWFFGPRLIELQMTLFCGAYLLFQIVLATINKFAMSSEMLHLTGAGVGTVFGAGMLKLNWVDCEGWDFFAVWAGKEGAKKKSSKESKVRTKDMPPAIDLKPLLTDDHRQFLASSIRNRLLTADHAGAAKLYLHHRNDYPDWQLSEPDLLALVKAMHQHNLLGDSVPIMVDYLRQYPVKSVRMRLKLAQILTDSEKRPTRALKVLGKLQPGTLPDDLCAIHAKLVAKAQKLQDDCDFEVMDGEDW